jgi:hypothetical protein
MESTGTAEISLPHIQILALQLSLNCQAACRPCVYDCHPKRSRVMSLAEARGIIDQARGMSLTRDFGFSGGEPFLHLDLVRELCRHIRKNFGYKISISTNGFWADSPGRAAAILGELVESGLWALLVSVDDFHLEFVDARRIETCVRTAVGLGVKCSIQSIETRSSRKVKDLQAALDIPTDSRLVEWVPVPCDPVGRGERMIPSGELLLDWKNKPGVCSMLKVWIVDPDGWVFACCGTALSDYLRLGNAFEEDLSDIARRANVDPLLNALAAWGGPHLLIDLLAEAGDSRYADESFTSACHACHRLFQDRAAVERVLPTLKERWMDLLASRLVAHKQVYEGQRAQSPDGIWLPSPRLF